MLKASRDYKYLDCRNKKRKNPEKLWTFFESQLQININFRVHRLQLMSMRHSEHETLDDFCMRARTTALKCQFEEKELEERIIELIIASAPIEAFQRELLSKEKGFTLEQTLQEGRRFKAIIEGKSKLKAMVVPPVNIAEQQMKKKCKNCGLTHPPRKCPTYGDTCRACGKKNHWKNVCRSKHSHNDRRNKEDSRKLSHQKKKKSRNINEFGNSDSENTNSSDSDEQFDCVQISVLCRTMRKEAFTNLHIRLPQKKGKHKLKLKIDSGAAGNTLPVRTIRQMYGDKYKDVIQRAHNVRLTAYNGQDIPCLGSISISIKKQKKKKKKKKKGTYLPNSTWWTYLDQQ